MMSRRGRTVSFLLSMLIVAGCGATEASAVTLIPTCTGQNVAGYPYSGTLCAGWAIDGCTPGLLYNCIGGPRGTQNNCTLQTICNTGCLSGANSTPVTLNTSTPRASDACFSGSAPLTLSSSSVGGGSNVTFAATLQATHNPYAIVNLQQLGAAIAQPCNVPILLLPGSTSISIPLPTAVVTSQTQASPWALISYNDSSGANRNLVSRVQSLTIDTGGSVVIPPLASFVIDDFNGNPITTITGGSSVITNATLSGPAPFGGVSVTVASNPTSAFTINGDPSIPAACTSTTQQQTSGNLTATSSATSNISATVTASDGAGSQLSENVTITPPPLTIGNVILNPTSVTGGSSLTATITLNRVVVSSDPSSTVSVRVSEGEPSGVQIATFSGCTGSPACTGPLTIPVGASSASVTITTSSVASQQFVTIAASATWSQVSASANFVDNTGPCTPNTCSGLGFNCGSISNGCGGTLSCGTCGSGQTCTNNLCVSGGGSVTLSSLTLSPTSVSGGNDSQGTVTLMANASANTTVNLSSNNSSVASVPSTVTVAAGSKSAKFTIKTNRVSNSTNVTITASQGGVTKTATLTVTSGGRN